MALWTLREPRGNVPTTGMEVWDLIEILSEGAESVRAKFKRTLDVPPGAGDAVSPTSTAGEGSSPLTTCDWAAPTSSWLSGSCVDVIFEIP